MNETINPTNKEIKKDLGSVELWRGIHGGSDAGGYARGISLESARENGVSNVNRSKQQLGMVNHGKNTRLEPVDFIVPKPSDPYSTDELAPDYRGFFGLQLYFDRASAEGWIKDRKYRDHPPLLAKLTIPIHLLDINNPDAIGLLSRNYTDPGKNALLTVEELSKIRASKQKDMSEYSLINPFGGDVDLTQLRTFETLYIPTHFEPWTKLENIEFTELK
jgi:hypothetical protein